MFRISCQFFCLDNDCFIYDKSFRGKTLKQLQSIESAAVCQLMCQRDPACVQFNYITEAFLKGAIHRKRPKGPRGRHRWSWRHYCWSSQLHRWEHFAVSRIIAKLNHLNLPLLPIRFLVWDLVNVTILAA